MSDGKITHLKNIRGGYKGIITQYLSKLEEIKRNPHRYLESVNDIRNKIDECSKNILEHLTEQKDIEREATESYTYRGNINELIHTIKGYIAALEVTPPNPSTHVVNDDQSSKHRIKLPLLDIRKFSGNIIYWTAFWESFEEAVDKNRDIADSIKFQYLISYLDGDARRLLNGLPRDSAHYKIATDLLKETYGNKQVIINSHMERIFNLKPVHQPSQIKPFYEIVTSNVRSLKAAGVDSSCFDHVIVPLILKKLPYETKRNFLKQTKGSLITLDKMMKYLHEDVELNDTCDSLFSFQTNFKPKQFVVKNDSWNSNRNNNNFKNTFNENKPFNNYHSNSRSLDKIGSSNKSVPYKTSFNKSPIENSRPQPYTSNAPCSYCESSHPSKFCSEYTSIPDRQTRCRELNLCRVCLKTGHFQRDCSRSCGYCKEPHHISLCYKLKNKPTSNNQSAASTSSASNINENGIQKIHSTNLSQSLSILQTAKISVCGSHGKTENINVLFDNGSQVSFATNSLCNRLGVPTLKAPDLGYTCFGSSKSNFVKTNKAYIKVKSSFGHTVIPVLTIDQIGGRFSQKCNESMGKNLKGINLNNANIEGEVDLLIGCDNYWTCVTGEIINKFSGPVAINSIFGWLISGKIPSTPSNNSFRVYMVYHNEDILEDWKHEQFNDKTDPTIDNFASKIIKNNSRYEVDLPWRSGMNLVESNYFLSQKRLNSIKNTLHKTGNYEKYDNVISSYLQKDYIEPCPRTSVECFLPHHAVIKQDRTTTKLRIVFDGSAKTNRSYSLNECLYKGPTLLNDLVGMLIKFRIGSVAMTGDLEEAFLQIEIQQKNRDYLKFLWYKDGLETIYRFKRLPFGLSCSPFLLNATIQHHISLQNSELYKNFYVDDFLYADESETDLLSICNDCTKMMTTAGFNMRKWGTNSNSLARQSPFISEEDPFSERSVLGMTWNPILDTICVKASKFEEPKKYTRRTVLSLLSQIFDPLGLFLPSTIRFRWFFTSLELSTSDWDSPLSESQTTQFISLLEDNKKISSSQLKRCVCPRIKTNLKLHIFSDASGTAYGACAYIQTTNELDESTDLTLIRSRVKICKKNKITIPRLELAATIIGVRLYENLLECDSFFQDIPVTFWTDSMAALKWIQGVKQWPPFIENRVAIVRNLGLTTKFQYICSEENPADPLSRGLSFDKLEKSKLWWNGPSSNYIKPTTCNQHLISIFLTTFDNEPIIDFNRFSSLQKLIKTAFYVLKFIGKLKHRECLFEFDTILNILIQLDQEIYFSVEREMLEKGKRVTSFKNLNLVLYNNLVCVKTRFLHHSVLPSNIILLSNKSKLTELIIYREHLHSMHNGARHVLSELRLKYWIIQGKKTTQKIIKDCVHCKKLEGPSYQTDEFAPLPKFRCERTLAFVNIGVDFAGPFLVKANLTSRKQPFIKAYICLFVCATSRAIHLEIALDMTTGAFIEIFRRFVAVRGVPNFICSDNGKNFEGASKIIAKYINGSTNTSFACNEFMNSCIKWYFIPPRSPWWGGFYERMVQIVKKTLKKVMTDKACNYIEFETIVKRIEGLVNDRPLTEIQEDTEQKIITPSMLLLGRLTHEIVDEHSTCSDEKFITNRLKTMNNIYSNFWSVFYKDYLLGLKDFKHKIHTKCIVPEVGDVVHIKVENLPRHQWRLGRIVELIPGKDNVVRSAKVRTPLGNHCTEILRPIQHLYPLEMIRDNDQ